MIELKSNKPILFFIIFLSFLILACTISTVCAADNFNYTGPADSSSPGFNGANSNGQSVYNGPQSNNTKYNSTISSDLYISIGSDGTIYGADGNKVYAFYANNGSVKWEYDLLPNVNRIAAYYPAIGNNETIYVSTKGILYAINYDGTENWTYNTGLTGSSLVSTYYSPVIGSDGTIYVTFYNTASNARFFAFNPNGEVKFNLSIPAISTTSPVFDSNGYIYIGARVETSSLYKINPGTGDYEIILTGYRVYGGLTIGKDGTIYAIVDDGSQYNPFLIALYSNGSLKWITDNLNQYYGSIVNNDYSPLIIGVSDSGLIYLKNLIINSVDGSILSNGTFLTTKNVVIGADGTIYVANANDVSAFKNDILLWKYEVLGAYNPVIGDDGTLYFTAGSKLYAIKDLDTTPPTITSSVESGTYKDPVHVYLTISEAGKIYYTTDGSDPHNSSTRKEYTDCIAVSSSTVLRYVAIDEADNPSEIYVLDLNIDDVGPTVSTSHGSGTYYGDINVVLTISESGKIYYTTDGSDPSSSSTRKEYTGSIAISSTTTLRYFAVDDIGNPSQPYLLHYVLEKSLTPANPSKAPGSYKSNVAVSLPTVAGSTLYYKIDNGDYKKYTGAFTLTKTGTVSYYYLDANGAKSKVKSVKYTIDKTAPKVKETNTKKFKAVKAKKQTLKIKFSENVKITKANLKKILVKTTNGKKIKVSISVKNNVLSVKIPKIAKKTKFVITIPKNIVKDNVGNVLKSKTALKYVSA